MISRKVLYQLDWAHVGGNIMGHKEWKPEISPSKQPLLGLVSLGKKTAAEVKMLVRVGVVRSWSRQCHMSADDAKWLTLPAVSATVKSSSNEVSSSSSTTALKWVTQCCPQIPKTLVHKLFRLRQVRMLPNSPLIADKLKRVGAKDTLNSGDRIFLPNSVKQQHQHQQTPKQPLTLTPKQIKFMRSLVIYKVAFLFQFRSFIHSFIHSNF